MVHSDQPGSWEFLQVDVSKMWIFQPFSLCANTLLKSLNKVCLDWTDFLSYAEKSWLQLYNIPDPQTSNVFPTLGHTEMGMPFVYAPYVYWKMVAYQNVILFQFNVNN